MKVSNFLKFDNVKYVQHNIVEKTNMQNNRNHAIYGISHQIEIGLKLVENDAFK